MKIEHVSKMDLEDLKEIAKLAIEQSVDAEETIKKDLILDTYSHIEKGIEITDKVYLKCVTDRVLGFILIREYWNLSDLFVSPPHHGAGAGSFLVKQAIGLCRSADNKGYIRVNSSKNAVGFYKHLGFESFAPSNEVPEFVVPLIYNF
jgi:GNAT superfamily N-acetyltransferase